MSSGFGFSGGTGRCFGIWQNFMECYTNNDTNHPRECTPQADDYFECLHRPKEAIRAQQIRAEYKKQQAGETKEKVHGVSVKKELPEALGLVN
jgi:NADH dehydrogenase (ubiquinone) Fe-S protein 5